MVANQRRAPRCEGSQLGQTPLRWTAVGVRRSELCLLLISSPETLLLLLPLNNVEVALGEQCLGGRSGMLMEGLHSPRSSQFLGSSTFQFGIPRHTVWKTGRGDLLLFDHLSS